MNQLEIIKLNHVYIGKIRVFIAQGFLTDFSYFTIFKSSMSVPTSLIWCPCSIYKVPFAF